MANHITTSAPHITIPKSFACLAFLLLSCGKQSLKIDNYKTPSKSTEIGRTLKKTAVLVKKPSHSVFLDQRSDSYKDKFIRNLGGLPYLIFSSEYVFLGADWSGADANSTDNPVEDKYFSLDFLNDKDLYFVFECRSQKSLYDDTGSVWSLTEHLKIFCSNRNYPSVFIEDIEMISPSLRHRLAEVFKGAPFKIIEFSKDGYIIGTYNHCVILSPFEYTFPEESVEVVTHYNCD